MPEPIYQLTNLIKNEPVFLAIGVFDGLHLGHQRLLQRMKEAAVAVGARPGVLTFFPHPKVVTQGISGRIYLTTLEQRLTLLAEQGMEIIIPHTFDEQVRNTRAADFIDQLGKHLHLRQLWGGDFSLGYKREGNGQFLSQLGQSRGFTVQTLTDLVMADGQLVSSSRVRESLASGRIADVNGCLGRPFDVAGEVIHGDQRGRTIGFPTANLAVWEQHLLPANGVYATYAWLGPERFKAATNVGVRPTVNGQRLSVEAHLLDFDRDIYGQQLRLEFMATIREERKFNGLEALKAQIRADVTQVNEQLL